MRAKGRETLPKGSAQSEGHQEGECGWKGESNGCITGTAAKDVSRSQAVHGLQDHVTYFYLDFNCNWETLKDSSSGIYHHFFFY